MAAMRPTEKFPSIANVSFRDAPVTDPDRNAHARDVVFRQLDAMHAGRIHDHLGGGSHHFASDRD